MEILPKVIDIHAHVGDIICGRPLDHAYQWPVSTIADLMEKSGYRIISSQGLGKLGRYVEVIHIHQRNNCATMNNLRRYSQPYGITHSVLLPIEPMVSTEFTLDIAGATDTPDHCSLSFASVDPKDPDKTAKLKKYMDLGCLGLKLHPILQDTKPDDEAYFEILETFKKYNKPVLIHAGKNEYYIPFSKSSEYGDVAGFEKLIAAFPEVPFIIAHMNMSQPGKVWELARKYENVFADASFQPASKIKQAFRQMGEDRVLFGTDCPFSMPKFAIKVGKKATNGSRRLQEKFFFRNAEALIGELEMPSSYIFKSRRKSTD